MTDTLKPCPLLHVGDLVEKVSGYRFPGIVTAIDASTAEVDGSGIRYVVTADHPDFNGMKHIFAPTQLRRRSPPVAAIGEEMRVKPLDWRKERDSTLSRAETIVGTYRVWTHHEAGGRWFWSLRVAWGLPAETEAEVSDEAEGIAAAQSDFEQRIRSALSTTVGERQAEAEPYPCDKCGKNYDYDLLVPDEVWAKIAPRPIDGWKSGGLMCPGCIVEALVARPAEAGWRERIERIRLYAEDCMTTQHVGAGARGNLMSIRDECDAMLAVAPEKEGEQP